MFKKIVARTGIALGAAALMVGATGGPAGAVSGAGYVGDGYANSGAAVWCTQHQLNDIIRKVGGQEIAEDSVWGPQTKNGVIWLQARLGIQQDGVVGPETGNWLLYSGGQYYGGKNGYCFWNLPSNWRLEAMYVGTELT
ncbi:peptidoglycan-binding domain-containing protein [Streptomyces sp. NPDC055815]